MKRNYWSLVSLVLIGVNFALKSDWIYVYWVALAAFLILINKRLSLTMKNVLTVVSLIVFIIFMIFDFSVTGLFSILFIPAFHLDFYGRILKHNE